MAQDNMPDVAQVSQAYRTKIGKFYAPSRNDHLNVRAVDDAISDGLSKIPIVKKVLRSRDDTEFNVIIIHSSKNNTAALERIVERMLENEDQLKNPVGAPDDICLKRTILRESSTDPY